MGDPREGDEATGPLGDGDDRYGQVGVGVQGPERGEVFCAGILMGDEQFNTHAPLSRPEEGIV